ncbi:MAG TPA: hypothetical protein VGJ18_12530 [Gemmatimonadaceae bacterium]|jgi:hypothetical protein
MSSGAKTGGKPGRGEGVFDLASYAPVAERITLFYRAFPRGRIITELMSRTERDVVFRALVYRDAADGDAAATGWAAEREGDGEINTVACLENTETSAIGRALANLGFTASRERPSAEEMAKVSRRRAMLVREPANPELQHRADDVLDVLALLRVAARLGVRQRRVQRLRERIIASSTSADVVDRLADLLRRWNEKRRRELLGRDRNG